MSVVCFRYNIININTIQKLSTLDYNLLTKLDLEISQKDPQSVLYVEEIEPELFSVSFKSNFFTFSDLIKTKENTFDRLKSFRESFRKIRVPSYEMLKEERERKEALERLAEKEKTLNQKFGR
jgi:hypothetical protein